MERPIIFNDAMVRRILSGDKRQTRRPAKGKPAPWRVGDLLWVRECFALFVAPNGAEGVAYRANCPENRFTWAEDGEIAEMVVARWAPSIHMPRCASRITLRVTGVRTEPLQSMREEDALAEGFDPIPAHGKWVIAPRHEGGHWSARQAFAATWDAIYPAMPWASNPWVWVVRFKRQGGE